jgi:hypothetical protein
MTVPTISDNGAGTDGFPSGGGGITYLQKTPNTAAPDAGNVEALTTTAFGSSVAEGSMIVACCTQSQSSGTVQPVFTDSKGNTWYIDLDVLTSDAVNRLTIAHCFVAAGKGGTGFTVTATTAGHTHYLDLGAAEFSGIDISLVAGGSGSNSGNGTSTSPTSNQVTVSGNHLYIGLLTFSVGASTITPAWTQLHEDETWVNSPFGSQYKIDLGNQTSTWTMGTSRPWAAGVVAYKETAGGTLDQTIKRVITCG